MALGLALRAIPPLLKAAAPIAGAALGGKSPISFLTYLGLSEIAKHTLINPVLKATGIYQGTPVALPPGYGPQAKYQPGGAPMTQREMDFLYGEQPGIFGIGYWPWQRQQGYLDRRMDQQREIAGMGYATQREIAGIQAGTQRHGYDTQRQIAGMGYNTQRDISRMIQDTQRFGITSGERQSYAGMRTQLGLANRQLAGIYDSNRRDVMIAGIGANRDRYLADRNLDAVRADPRPRLAALTGVFSRRY
jgi:hypothetical protein